jgi:hypothetical protein
MHWPLHTRSPGGHAQVPASQNEPPGAVQSVALQHDAMSMHWPLHAF